MKIKSISVCAERGISVKKWYWSIGLNFSNNRAFYLESDILGKFFSTEKDAIANANKFIKLNIKKAEVYYPR